MVPNYRSAVPFLLALVFVWQLSPPGETKLPTPDAKIEVQWKPGVVEVPSGPELDLLAGILEELRQLLGNRERSHHG